MDYEEKYKEALDRAKGLLEGMKEGNYNALEDDIIDIFPELKKSEDDKIRKEIIRIFKGETRYTSEEDTDKYVAWLEKQSEKKGYTFKPIPRLLDMIVPSEKAKFYCQKLINALTKEGYDTDAKIVSNCLKQMNGEEVAMATMDEVEKQRENKAAEDDKMRREILELVSISGIDYNQYDEIKDWLEKQSKKKSADEVMKIRRKSYSDGYMHGQDNIAIALGKESVEALEHFVRSIGESGYASPYDNRTKLVYRLLEQLKQMVK